MKLLKILLLSLSVSVFVSGCTDAQHALIIANGSEFQIELYSGGICVKTWTSTGKVLSEDKSDGYFFMDKETKKLVRTSGTLVITQK